MSIFSKYDFLMFIGVITIWLTITSVNYAKIIFLLPGQKGLTAYFLQHFSFKTASVSASNSKNISWIVKILFLTLKTNSKGFYAKTLAIWESLWIVFGAKLNKTLNINKRIF